MVVGIFSLISILIFVIALRIKKSEKAVTLWANTTDSMVVKDIKAYNTACYQLMRNYAIVLFLIGLLISTGQILFIILGYLSVVFASIILMVMYTFIESKHRL